MPDQQALPPRRSLTAGRELPARRGEAPMTAPALAPRSSRPARPLDAEARDGIEHRPVAARFAATQHRSVNRPDPRPMRIVYGAGAVAAMSIMAVGLVQPDWSSTADQGPTDDSWATDDPGAVAVLPNGKTEDRWPDPTSSHRHGGASVKVRHVIRYVYLKPGETAPPGATVVSATAAPPRVGRDRANRPGPTATPRHGGGGNTGGAAATPRPTQAPAATPRPTPRPTPTSRQSGRR